jgi:hypothetical protein
VKALTAYTATYTADQAVAVLVGEGHDRDDVVTAVDSLIHAGLEPKQPDDMTVISPAKPDVLRDHLAST